MEQVQDRGEREKAYAENQIYVHSRPQGKRYTKGTAVSAQKRSWQSLDAVLRSSQHSSAALPYRQQRLSRLFTALTVVASIVTVAGAAASAREGLNLGELNGTGALLLGGALATVGFGITSGIFYGKTRHGYEDAVDIYNDSLGMRLGILDGEGEFIPARGTILDEDGYVVLDPTADDVVAEPEPAVKAPAPKPIEPASSDPVSSGAASDEAPTEPAAEADVAAEEPAAVPEAPTAEAGTDASPDPSEPSTDATIVEPPPSVARLQLLR